MAPRGCPRAVPGPGAKGPGKVPEAQTATEAPQPPSQRRPPLLLPTAPGRGEAGGEGGPGDPQFSAAAGDAGAGGRGVQPPGGLLPRLRQAERDAAAEPGVFGSGDRARGGKGRRGHFFLALEVPLVALSPFPRLILDVCSKQQEILGEGEKAWGCDRPWQLLSLTGGHAPRHPPHLREGGWMGTGGSASPCA